MNNINNITSGNINKSLLKLSLPLITTAFIQVAYNFVDMIYLGRISTEAIAGVGIAFFVFWFAISLSIIPKVGMGVFASRAYWSNNKKETVKVIHNGLVLAAIIGLLYTLFIFMFGDSFIDIFKLSSKSNGFAKDYLFFSGFGIILFIINPGISQAFIAIGDPLIPFTFNTIGAIINIILDPIIIFGLGSFKGLGVKGAALATGIGQLLVFMGFLIIILKRYGIIKKAFERSEYEYRWIRDIFMLGLPAGVLSGFQHIVTIILNGYTSRFGDIAVAVSSIGHQIESITWNTTDAIQMAIQFLIGQNYGLGNKTRIKDAVRASLRLTIFIGIMSGAILILYRESLMKIFIPSDNETINLGMKYLSIASVSQVFFSAESGSTGVFNGLMDSKTPSIVGLVFNFLKIPLSLILMKNLGVEGIWISITITTIIKGLLDVILIKNKCRILLKK